MAHFGTSRLLAQPARAVALRFGMAVVTAMSALGATLVLYHYDLPHPFISFSLVAIAITFWIAGTGPGLVALLLSSLGLSWLARNHLLIPGLSFASYLIFYAIFSLFVSWLSASRRQTQRLLEEERNNLEIRVKGRTAELTRANDELRTTQAALQSE